MKIKFSHCLLFPPITWSQQSLESSFSGILSLEHPLSYFCNNWSFTSQCFWIWYIYFKGFFEILVGNILSIAPLVHNSECIFQITFIKHTMWTLHHNFWKTFKIKFVSKGSTSIQLIQSFTGAVETFSYNLNSCVCSFLLL